MTAITIEEIESDLAGFIRRLQARERLLILEANTPVAEVTPVQEAVDARTGSLRPFGLCAGEFTVPDDFDDPLPEELLAEFEGA